MSKLWNPAKNFSRDEIGAEFDELDISTKTLVSRLEPITPDFDPIAIPIYQTSVYRNSSIQQYADILKEGGYIYQRLGNRTSESAEVIINELESGKGTLMYTSGLAAMSSIFLCFLKAGDHVVCPNPIYSGTMKFIEETLVKFGVSVSYVNSTVSSVLDYEKAIRPNTRIIYAEVPCNPTMSILNLKDFGKLSLTHPNIISVVDGTFASPYIQQPLKHGVDISFHSCSKFLGGHTDLIGGCVTVNDVSRWKILKNYQSTVGNALSAFDSYLLVRGLKTLAIRMDRHCSNAMIVAKFLESHPKVKKVWYPGLESHPQHKNACEQMNGYGGMIAFEMADKQAAVKLVENLKIINLAVSLGGTESLIEHPATMTHGPMLMSDDDRLKSGITDGLIRFSVGLEHPEDLKKDLAQALAHID